jgi:hypothetical protein
MRKGVKVYFSASAKISSDTDIKIIFVIQKIEP